MTNSVISRVKETVPTCNIILKFKKADGFKPLKDSREVSLKDQNENVILIPGASSVFMTRVAKMK